MTDQQIEDAKNAAKAAIKVYVNDTNSANALIAIQMLISAMITNAGSLENLTAIKAALDARFGAGP